MTTVISPAATLTIETFRAPDGRCVGYLAVDEPSRTAVAIDPRLDQVAAFLDSLRARDVALVYALDTHTHADHLSGVRRLAREADATVLAHAASRLKHPARRVQGGDTFALGGTRARVIDAPGHTPDSLAILIDGHLFTGDALLAGGAGRTDFMGGSAAELFDTFRRFEGLPDATVVHPGHDYVGRAVTTIGEEKAQNELFRERDRAALVSRLSAKTQPPANMAAILRYNLGETEAATVAPGDVESLREHGSELFFLDVRSPLEFEGERIEEARNIPLEELDARLDEVPEQALVVLVCRTGVRATIAAETLGRAGRRAKVLEGGMNAWRRARLPLLEGRKRLPIDRQVQLIVGLMVLTGVTLGAFVSAWFLVIAAFFGAGLAFAGITGTCGLALLLMRMPWNRPARVAPGADTVCAAGSGASASCAAPAPPRR
jgi:glyoxylase-like metal-dependent hydrolase (beta-lactamase superfamily II)